jgi:hypothetical protein
MTDVPDGKRRGWRRWAWGSAAILVAALVDPCAALWAVPVETQLTHSDIAVIAAALDHFVNHESVLNKKAKTLLVVGHETVGSYPYDYAPKRRGIGGKEWSIPFENYVNLTRRNVSRVSTRGHSFGTNVVIEDLSQFNGFKNPFTDAIKTRYPAFDRSMYLILWLPGYSLDGKLSLLEFRFGPTAHGAHATYLLSKENGGWAVKEYRLAHNL